MTSATSTPSIAVVRLDNLGDHVLGAGLLTALRATYPQSRIAVVIPAGLADLYRHCPAINHLVAAPAKEQYLQQTVRYLQILGELRAAEKFDLVINPRYAEDHYLAAPFCQALGAPGARIVGFRQDATPYPGYDPNSFFSELVESRSDLHASRYAGVMARHLGATAAAEPVVWFSSAEAAAIRAQYSLEGEPYVVVGCGASFPYKLPSPELYRHLVARLTSSWAGRIVLVGAAADQPVGAVISQQFPAAKITSTIGELGLHQLSALLSGARLYVGPDSGPIHMAAATGIPVIEIGWVPASYPRTSRGGGTAGWCWSPWSTRGVSVRPDAEGFTRHMSDPEFARQPIRDIPTTELDAALAAALETTV
jgi:ADP-heptose:LPS heptosyltransferase